jgi:hypothetical protein
VKNGFATLYRYPVGDKPGTINAVKLGTSRVGLAQAAKQLGVSSSDITDESAS